MGEGAEMMLDGTCCSVCGEYLGDGDGWPVVCAACEMNEPPIPTADEKPKQQKGFLSKVGPNSTKTNCPHCNKRVKNSGLNDHINAIHKVSKYEFG